MDQASTLRHIVSHNKGQSPPRPRPGRAMRVICVTSGKGGVGKSNIVLNLSLALSRLERKVFLLDADMGLANVDVLLGLTPRYTLEHVMSGRKDINDIILTGPNGIRILPSGSGISELSEMTFEQQMFLFQELSRLDAEIDYLLIDTGAGISSNVLRFNASAQEVVIVSNPEPTAITDAYALMKLLAIKYHIRGFSLIANSVTSVKDGEAMFQRLESACAQFLQVSLKYLGPVPYDSAVRKAVRQQKVLLDLFPTSPAARSLVRIARRIDGEAGAVPVPLPRQAAPQAVTPASFWDRLLHWKKAK